MVGVAPHQGRQIERYRQPGTTGGNQDFVTLVGLFRRAEPGTVPHRPELAAVASRVDAARVRKLARVADVAVVIDALSIFGGVEPLDPAPGNGREGALSLRG